MKKEELLERSETFLRGFFEKGLPVEDLLAGADPVDFSWIGPGEKEFFDNRDALLAWYRRAAVQKARKTGPVIALEMQCAFPRRRRRGSHRPLLGVRRTEPSRIPGHPHLHEKTGPPPPRPRAPLRPVGQGGRINYEFLKAAEEAGRHAAAPKFTARQQRLLAFLRQGYTYKEIGELMNISQRTVRYYVNELIYRCRVENRAQLIAATRKWRKRLGGWKTKNKQT